VYNKQIIKKNFFIIVIKYILGTIQFLFKTFFSISHSFDDIYSITIHPVAL